MYQHPSYDSTKSILKNGTKMNVNKPGAYDEQNNYPYDINITQINNKLNKYQFVLKYDNLYCDRKVKLKINGAFNLADDLRHLKQFTKIALDTHVIEKMKKSTVRFKDDDDHLKRIKSTINFGKDYTKANSGDMTKIEFDALDLTAERELINSPIHKLPDELFKFVQLKRLHLDSNEITFIPDKMGIYLINLQVLTLSNNKLSKLPDTIGNIKYLESIHLSGNKFEQFPTILCDLRHLIFLDLSFNRIQMLPSRLGDLTSLQSLLLFNNNLTDLPNALCRLINLRTLWIGNNRIEKLPRDFGKLVYLDWKKQTSISTNFQGCPLVSPPIDVCEMGMEAIAKYFLHN